MERLRRNHYDVTNQVCIANPHEVETAVRGILLARYPDLDCAPLAQAFDTSPGCMPGRCPAMSAATPGITTRSTAWTAR